MGSNKIRRIREEIENEFKPLFNEAVDGGIPLVELRVKMKDSRLPPRKVNEFLMSADRDKNSLITYDEFYNQITYVYSMILNSSNWLTEKQLIRCEKFFLLVTQQRSMLKFSWCKKIQNIHMNLFTSIILLTEKQESTNKMWEVLIKKLKERSDQQGIEEDKTDDFLNLTRTDEKTLLGMTKRIINKAVMAVAPYRKIEIQPVDAEEYMNWGELKVENYIEAYDCKPPPLMIPLITLAEIAVFIYFAIKLNSDDDKTNDVTANSGTSLANPLIYNPFRRVQAWRFITYMFLHNGYTHLIFNCIIQLVLGTLLELVHKFWRVGIVYVLGVLAGSLAHSCFDAKKYLAGASGGCFALIGAHLATVVTNWDTMQKGWLDNPVNFLTSGVFRLILILLLSGGNIGIAIYNRLSSEISTKVGFSAHIGGLLAGILLGVPVLRNLEVKTWEKICFWICIVFYCAFMIGAIVFNVICDSKDLCYATNWAVP